MQGTYLKEILQRLRETKYREQGEKESLERIENFEFEKNKGKKRTFFTEVTLGSHDHNGGLGIYPLSLIE